MIISAVSFAVVPAIPLVLGLMGVLHDETPGLLAILIVFAMRATAR